MPEQIKIQRKISIYSVELIIEAVDSSKAGFRALLESKSLAAVNSIDFADALARKSPSFASFYVFGQ